MDNPRELANRTLGIEKNRADPKPTKVFSFFPIGIRPDFLAKSSSFLVEARRCFSLAISAQRKHLQKSEKPKNPDQKITTKNTKGSQNLKSEILITYLISYN